MPPRRSASGAASSSSALQYPVSSASSTPALSVADLLPEDCTPGYVPLDPARAPGSAVSGLRKGKGKETAKEGTSLNFTEEERTRLMLELIDFDPFAFLNDLSTAASSEVTTVLDGLTGWFTALAGQVADTCGDEEVARRAEEEVNTGLTTLESLLLSHTSNQFDLLSSWALRNSFGYREGLKMTLPWHQGFDFARAQHVANLPEGEHALREELEFLRGQVEDMRKLKYKLELADRKMDSKVALMEKTKDEVGFVVQLSEEAGLTPLPRTSQSIINNITSLQGNLTQLELVPPPPVPTYPTTAGSAVGPKEWEYGRAAYLNWATNQAMSSTASRSHSDRAEAMDVDATVDAQADGGEQAEAEAKERERAGLANMRDQLRGVASEEGLLKMSGAL